MELEFENTKLSCLTPLVSAWQQQEQTQEVKLPEGMPDIGRTLGAWGQWILRSKQWNNDGMSVNGGVLAWVLYAPEDGSEPRSMETWIPFQNGWQFPRQEREGAILTSGMLCSVDARTLSARKLMLRANIASFGQALLPGDVEIPCAKEVPDGVQLLQNRYPMRLMREAGEKNFLLDEDLNLGAGKPEKLVRYSLEPVVAEQKVMGQKLVFRGTALMHVLCRGADEKLFARDLEIPFSQFAELERDYGQEATAQVVCCVTNLEPELTEDGMLRLKCGITGQYVIMNEEMVELTEDGYGLGRDAELKFTELRIPAVLDSRSETITAEQPAGTEIMGLIDCTFTAEPPRTYREEEENYAGMEGTFTQMGYDAEGKLQCMTSRWNSRVPLPRGETGVLLAGMTRAPRVAGNLAEMEMELSQQVMAEKTMPAVSGLTVGEKHPMDPGRPSLVLRRSGEDSLWQVAKSCGSTVELIKKANGFDQTPNPERMLLIPVV